MESLLSLSFDYLTSCNADKIRKGLRQLEGLLAQICLSKNGHAGRDGAGAARGHAKRHSVAVLPSAAQLGKPTTPPSRDLTQLSEDPAFREFFKLQEGFEYNVAIRLIACLEKLLGKSENTDLLLVSTLSLLHGSLLLHPPSRSLFARETNMNLLLDLLYPSSSSCPAIQAQTLLVLVTALLDSPGCARTFEALDGLLTVTSVAKESGMSKEVKLKSMEFLYFYLMPETPWGWSSNDPGEQGRDGGGGGGGGGAADVWDEEKADSITRSMRDKQRLLARHISNVDELVEDLMQGQAFGGFVA